MSEVIYFSNINSDELSDCTLEEFQSLIKKDWKRGQQRYLFCVLQLPHSKFCRLQWNSLIILTVGMLVRKADNFSQFIHYIWLRFIYPIRVIGTKHVKSFNDNRFQNVKFQLLTFTQRLICTQNWNTLKFHDCFWLNRPLC